MACKLPEAISKIEEILSKNVEGVASAMLSGIQINMLNEAKNNLQSAIEIRMSRMQSNNSGSESIDSTKKDFRSEFKNKRPSAAKWADKEVAKFDVATQAISDGTNNSTAGFVKDFYGDKANTGTYTKDDVVYLSTNGNRTGRIVPVKNGVLQGAYKNIDKAIKAGAKFVADTSKHLVSTGRYNIGEVELAEYLHSKGYVREDKDGYGLWSQGKSSTQITKVSKPITADELKIEKALSSDIDAVETPEDATKEWLSKRIDTLGLPEEVVDSMKNNMNRLNGLLYNGTKERSSEIVKNHYKLNQLLLNKLLTDEEKHLVEAMDELYTLNGELGAAVMAYRADTTYRDKIIKYLNLIKDIYGYPEALKLKPLLKDSTSYLKNRYYIDSYATNANKVYQSQFKYREFLFTKRGYITYVINDIADVLDQSFTKSFTQLKKTDYDKKAKFLNLFINTINEAYNNNDNPISSQFAEEYSQAYNPQSEPGVEYQKGENKEYDSKLDTKIANKLKNIYKDIEVVYLNGQKEMRSMLNELGGDIAMFQLSKKRREEFESKLGKSRLDLDNVSLTKILKNIEDFSELESNGDEKLMKKLELLALHWTIKGNVILPEDGSKIMQALKISEKEKFDPFSYNSPNEITEKYAHVSMKQKAINPDDYIGEGFSNKQIFGNTVIYDVDNNEVGRKSSRLAIDTHFGVDANPWCLLAKDNNGSISDSASYWFDTYPGAKKIVFIDGKLSYFYGGDKFWDRMDSPNEHIVSKDFYLSKEDIKKYKLSSYLKDSSNYVYKKTNINVSKDGNIKIEDNDSIITIEKQIKDNNTILIDRIELGYNGKITDEGTFEVLKNNKNSENPIGKHVHYRSNGKIMSIVNYDNNYQKTTSESYDDKGNIVSIEEPVDFPVKGQKVTTYYKTGNIKEISIKRPRGTPVVLEEYFSRDPKKDTPRRTKFIDVDNDGRIIYIEKVNGGLKKSTLEFDYKTLKLVYTDFDGSKNVETLDSSITNEEIISLAKDVMYYQKTKNDVIKGAAVINKNKILIDIENRSTDTLAHEYAHFYIAAFRDTPIVQEAISKFGGEEALVQSIGEQVVKQKGEVYGWWKQFSNWLRYIFSNLDKASKEELVGLLTDAFLTNKNLKENKPSEPGGVYNKYETISKDDIEAAKDIMSNNKKECE